ncbi:hypothetical protein D9M72_490330 [compost metagenome]
MPGYKLDAVFSRNVSLQSLAYRLRFHAVRPYQCRRRQGVGDHVAGGHRAEVRHRGKLSSAVFTLGDEGTVHQEALDHAEHADGRRQRGETDGAAAFHDVRVLHHAFCFDLLGVVDAGLLRLLINLRLVGQVRGVGSVPVHVVLSNVEDHTCDRGDGVAPVQLEA